MTPEGTGVEGGTSRGQGAGVRRASAWASSAESRRGQAHTAAGKGIQREEKQTPPGKGLVLLRSADKGAEMLSLILGAQWGKAGEWSRGCYGWPDSVLNVAPKGSFET